MVVHLRRQLARIVEQELGAEADAAQRRAQIVRGGVRERVMILDRPLEPLVEGDQLPLELATLRHVHD
ncbi:MAG: hypothetical protein PGN13_10515, partial [Patulibacter minatonensis]